MPSGLASAAPLIASAQGRRARRQARLIVAFSTSDDKASTGGAAASLPSASNDDYSDVSVTVSTDGEASGISYDEETKTVRIPLAALGQAGRRTKLVLFTCNQCGGRTSRMVNPVAWQKGVVFGQCSHCEVWHTLASNNSKILEEIRFDRNEDNDARQQTAANDGHAAPSGHGTAAESA